MNAFFIRCAMFACLSGLAIGGGAAFARPAEVPYETLLREADRIRTSEPQRFRNALDGLEQAVKRATPIQRMHLRLMQSHWAIISGDLPTAIRELRTLREAATDVDMRYRAGALLANAYALTAEFREGLIVLEETMPLSGKVQDRDSRHQGWLAAGILYNKIGEYDFGRHYAEKVLSEPASGRSSCIAENLRLEALQRLGRMPDDEEMLTAIRRCESVREPMMAGFSRSYLARKWFSEGRTDDAIDLLEKHLPEVESTGYPRLIGEIHSLLAEFRLSVRDFASAEHHARMAVAQSPGIANSLPLVTAHRVLYELAERRSDPIGALAHYRRYAEADKGYLSDVKARQLAYQLVRHQTQQKTQQIALLNQQNQVLKLQQRVDRQATQNLWLLVVLLALLVAGIGYWAYKIKRLHLSLRRFAETDALTGISNRHHFTQQSEQSLARCATAGESAALIMFDLDHFKTINDGYGHITGDWVLQQVAETCRSFCRRIDHLGRIGGEEFAILLHGCDLQAATRLAEDCRVRLTRIDTTDSGHAFAITASFGISATSLSGYGLPELMSHADQMLYRAKREGRNRVRAYARDVPITTQLLTAEPIEAS